jgi:pilus assembly protein CpaF
MRRSVFVDESESLVNPLALPAPVEVPESPATALSPALQHILKEVQREIGYGRVEDPENEFSQDYEELVSRIAERFGFDLTNYERDLIVAQVEKEQRPFGVIQDLVDDPKISDIIISAYNSVTVQQGRRNYSTGVVFPNQENYEAFVEKLLSRASSNYSTKKPIADGMIGSFARVHAVHASISDGGPYCTVRLNRFSSVTLKDLESNGLAPAPILAYLKAIVRSGHTVLVAGEVGTGKTTLTRALSSTMPHDE